MATYPIEGFSSAFKIYDNSHNQPRTVKNIVDTINKNSIIKQEIHKFNRMKIILVDTYPGADGFVLPQDAKTGDFNINLAVSSFAKYLLSWGHKDFENILIETIKHEGRHNLEYVKRYFSAVEPGIRSRLGSGMQKLSQEMKLAENDRTHAWKVLRFCIRDVINWIYLEGLAVVYANIDHISFTEQVYERMYQNALADIRKINSAFYEFEEYIKNKRKDVPSPTLFTGMHSLGELIVFEILFRTGMSFEQVSKMQPLTLLSKYEKISKNKPLFGLHKGVLSYDELLHQWTKLMKK